MQGNRLGVADMALAAGIQLLQLASQQLLPQSVAHLCVSELPLSACSEASCSQCGSVLVAGVSCMAQLLRSGTLASATASNSSRNFCRRVFIC